MENRLNKFAEFVKRSPFIPEFLRNMLRCIYIVFIRDRKKYIYTYLLRKPRFSKQMIKLENREIEIVDGESFFNMYSEVWVDEIYKLKNMPEKPYFLDCGANIGLATIYLKKNFPKAEIICFEPDQEIFKILKKNVSHHSGYSDVSVMNYGLWKEDGRLEFLSEGADGGRIRNEEDSGKIISINVIRLSRYINKTVDFIKMDIEGAEFEVLKEIESKLGLVKNLFIEYHSFVGQEQCLPELLLILKNAGFRMNLVSHGPFFKTPMYESVHSSGMDLQLNIFCTRNG